MTKNQKNIVWIDVGTHFGQELLATVGPSRLIFFAYLRRFLSAYILRRGHAYSMKSLYGIISKRTQLNASANIITIAVEANLHLFHKFVYKYCNMAFCLALGRSSEPKLTKLFLTSGKKYGQGSTIFEVKQGTSSDKFVTTFLIDPTVFFNNLKVILDERFSEVEYKVILRLNCEGAEDEVIRDCRSVFGQDLLLVAGSLKDVLEIKGDHQYFALNKYLCENNIKFVQFSSRWDTWNSALDVIIEFVNKN